MSKSIDEQILIDRVWAMPSIWTFKVKPIKELLDEEIVGKEWADPFAGFNSPASRQVTGIGSNNG